MQQLLTGEYFQFVWRCLTFESLGKQYWFKTMSNISSRTLARISWPRATCSLENTSPLDTHSSPKNHFPYRLLLLSGKYSKTCKHDTRRFRRRRGGAGRSWTARWWTNLCHFHLSMNKPPCGAFPALSSTKCPAWSYANLDVRCFLESPRGITYFSALSGGVKYHQQGP